MTPQNQDADDSVSITSSRPSGRPKIHRSLTDTVVRDQGYDSSDSSTSEPAGISRLHHKSPSIHTTALPGAATRSRRTPRGSSTKLEALATLQAVPPLERSKSSLDTAPDSTRIRSAFRKSSSYFKSIRSPRPSLSRLNSRVSVPPSVRSSLDLDRDTHLRYAPEHSMRRDHLSASIRNHAGYGAVPEALPTNSTLHSDDRRFYDDFTTIDWVRDSINDSSRREFLQSLPGLRGRLVRTLDGSQGWVLIGIVAFSFAVLAYMINIFETLLFDLKVGICSTNPFARYTACCDDDSDKCEAWMTWSHMLSRYTYGIEQTRIDFIVYFVLTVTFAFIATTLTVRTKTSSYVPNATVNAKAAPKETIPMIEKSPEPRVIYSAYGSGVPEVKTILSGFVIRRFLGTYTLFHKAVALVFSIASGMSLGKEGPFVHLAACVGNISCRLFPKYADNDLKRRQVLSAASSAGVALAFGSPLGGVLFSLEEVSYHFLPHHLFRIFFCAMMSALFLKFLDPYKTGKIVLFEVSYKDDWYGWELVVFVFLGIAGGIYGALFCKFTMWWPKVFRKKFIKAHPKTEVVIIAVVTACLTIGNQYTRSSISELLLDLASPCPSTHSMHPDDELTVSKLCPSKPQQIPAVLWPLVYALIVKIILTAVTFGIKVPAGIYVPSMVTGALFGRMAGMVLQYFALTTSTFDWIGPTASARVGNIVPGTYAMAGAGAFMAGITRMNVTLAVILFELTGSLNYVLPFSITILVANWIANAIEPKSLYELLIEKNNFPYLDNRLMVSFDSSLVDLVTRVAPQNMLDLSRGPYVTVGRLEAILARLHSRGEIDGCVPLVKGPVLVGLLSTPQLEFALDQIRSYFVSGVASDVEVNGVENLMCRVSVRESDLNRYHHYYASSTAPDFESDEDADEAEQPYLSHHSTHGGRQDSDTEDDDGINVVENGSDGHVVTVDDLELDLELEQYTDLTPYIDRAPLALDVHSPLALVQMMFSKLGPRVICVTKDGMFLGLLHKKKFIDFCLKKGSSH